MTNATAKATSSTDGFIYVGKAKFTKDEAIQHGSNVYDKLYLLQEQQLDYYRELGNILNQIRGLYKSDKLFGQYLKGTALGCMSRQDRSDAMFIANNWATIQKLNTNGALESLGVSAIRKRCAAASKPKASAGNTSKGKAKAEPKAEAKAATDGSSDTKFQTEAELAAFVAQSLKENGLDNVQFLIALKAALAA
jgi:hypothetical protein